MLIRRMYLSIKRECVALIFFLFCGFLFTETRKDAEIMIYFPWKTVHYKSLYTRIFDSRLKAMHIFISS